jgi:hypothetical protein
MFSKCAQETTTGSEVKKHMVPKNKVIAGTLALSAVSTAAALAIAAAVKARKGKKTEAELKAASEYTGKEIETW